MSPADADLTYDQSSGLVTWRPGSIGQNADVGSGARQVFFQVVFRPSVTQVGSTPGIVGQASFVGTDAFTGLRLQGSAARAFPLSSRPIRHGRTGRGRLLNRHGGGNLSLLY
jgi:hypothetical protein